MKIVAEAGACNGDIEYALKAARMAYAAGAWGFKVQMYQADKIATPWAVRYDHLPSNHDTQHSAFSNAIPYGAWSIIADEARHLGIEFFASCFDREAVDACEGMGVNYYKVASGEITNTPLLNYIGETKKKIILSTGASTFNEIIDSLRDLNLPVGNVTLLACSLEYPASSGAMGRITQLKDRFPNMMVGYSDHTLGIDSTAVAVALGATMLEKHFTITPGIGGDHDMAVTPTELHEMGMIVNRIDDLLYTPEQFGPMPEERDAWRGARRGVYYSKDLFIGDLVDETCVDYLRPATPAIYPAEAMELYGKRMCRQVKAGDIFVLSDVK